MYNCTFYSSLRKDFNHGLGRQKLPGQNPEEEGGVEGKKEVKIRVCALAVADLASPGGSGRFGREALSHSRNPRQPAACTVLLSSTHVHLSAGKASFDPIVGGAPAIRSSNDPCLPKSCNKYTIAHSIEVSGRTLIMW